MYGGMETSTGWRVHRVSFFLSQNSFLSRESSVHEVEKMFPICFPRHLNAKMLHRQDFYSGKIAGYGASHVHPFGRIMANTVINWLWFCLQSSHGSSLIVKWAENRSTLEKWYLSTRQPVDNTRM